MGFGYGLRKAHGIIHELYKAMTPRRCMGWDLGTEPSRGQTSAFAKKLSPDRNLGCYSMPRHTFSLGKQMTVVEMFGLIARGSNGKGKGKGSA
jgi:hypothetical protein